ncbi:MAG: hypothetical protein JXR85_11820 [Deltaproteobacteria bacterium]|nr:hypothetical protein [Deltaproteobacteria bacterium]
MELHDRMIITAASSGFGPSLLAMLGSLNLNWPGHPPVRVYDIGLDDETLHILDAHDVDVVKVPGFCPHWRKHFTWKIWCWNDAPAREIMWIDAGIVVLRPVDEIFEMLNTLGYFVVPTYHLLTENASEAACRGCGVDPAFRVGKMTLAGGFIGFNKSGTIQNIVEEALAVALTEEHIAATEQMHRHDQAIISLLMYRDLGNVVMADGTVYCGWLSPRQVPGQKVWVHRRALLKQDLDHFAAHISSPGLPHMPKDPLRDRQFRSAWKKVFGGLERFVRRLIKGELGKTESYNGVRNK